MTNHYARARRSRGSYYDALLVDQSRTVEGLTLDDLRDFDALVSASNAGHALVVADNPAPARGYALIFPLSETVVAARVHVIEDQPVEVYRALFSQTLVQARQLTGDDLNGIILDADAAASHVRDAVERMGAAYGLYPAEPGTLLEPDAAIEAAEVTPEGATSDHPEGDTDREDAEGNEESAETEATEEAEPAAPTEEAEEAEAEQPEEFTCPECGKPFSSQQGLRAHSRAHKK